MTVIRSLAMPRLQRSAAVDFDSAQHDERRYSLGIGCSRAYVYAASGRATSRNTVLPDRCCTMTATRVWRTNIGMKHGTLLIYSRIISCWPAPIARILNGAHQLNMYSFGPRMTRTPSIVSSRGA